MSYEEESGPVCRRCNNTGDVWVMGRYYGQCYCIFDEDENPNPNFLEDRVDSE